MAFKHNDHYHDTVAEARACASDITCRGSVPPRSEPMKNRTRNDAATEAQQEYITKLLESRQVPEPIRVNAETDRASWTKREASLAIDKLREFPPKPKVQSGLPKVEEGYYAVADDTEESNPLKFYHVSYEDKPGSKYHGWVRITVQASDDHHLIKSYDTKKRVLSAIAEDPQLHHELYASELGNCYRCGRTLTDEESRRLGIGPVCRGKEAA